MKPAATHLRLIDRVRREWYVVKVDFHAQDVPAGYRKELRRELRSDLVAAATDLGMSKAIRDVGPASVLAHQYKLAEGRRLPHVWTGIITFSILLYAWAGMAMAATNAITDGATQLGGDRTVTVHTTWLWANITVTQGERLSAGVELSWPILVVLVIVPLIAARAWRYRPAWLQRRLATRALTAHL
jgi:hypothetical protein